MEFEALVGRFSVNPFSEIFNKISRLSRKQKRLCEQFCNGDIDTEEYEKVLLKVETAIKEQVSKLQSYTTKGKIWVEFQHDPRGRTVLVKSKTEEGVFENEYLYLID